MRKNYYLFLPICLLLIGCKSRGPVNLRELEDKAYEASESGHFNASIYYYDQLIEKNSFNGSYYFGRGYSYMRLLSKEKAVSDFLKSAELKYRECSCYFNIGLMNTFREDSIALTNFKRALQMCPERNDIKKKYDDCLLRLKK